MIFKSKPTCVTCIAINELACKNSVICPYSLTDTTCCGSCRSTLGLSRRLRMQVNKIQLTNRFVFPLILVIIAGLVSTYVCHRLRKEFKKIPL
jgi:hypothetical protein